MTVNRSTTGAADNKGHVYGLDGLRAIAIIGVIFYHMFPYTIKGGFLGVSLFFVLSGYLIALTSEKSRRSGCFSVGGFYLKRLTRIYPPVILTVFVTVGAFHLIYPKAVEGVRNEVISILLGYNNWWQIAQNSSYFTKIANATPFTHIWSLAVELQFYVIWPVLYFIYLILANRGRKKRGLLFFLIISSISAILMGVLLPYGTDATRVYYGTDTRLYALTLGVMLGFAGVGTDEFRLFRSETARKASLPVFVISMIFLVISFIFVDGMADPTYTGLMQIVTVVISVLVIITAEPSLPFGRILENPVLDFIGKRSYEMYLFMYPVIFLFNVKKWTRIPCAPLIQIAIIMLLAIWEHEMVGWIVKRKLNITRKWKATLFFLATMAATVFIVVGIIATIFSGKKNTDTKELEQQLAANQKMLEQQESESSSQTSSVTSSSSASTSAATSSTSATSSSSTEDTEKQDELTAETKVPVTAIGDSVMLGASPELLKVLPDKSIVNAHESRQLWDAKDIIKDYKKKNKLGKIVVIALGTNGVFKEDAGQELIDMIGEDRHIYWVNVFGDSIQWEDDSNKVIKKLCDKNENVTLINWHEYAKGHDSWFYHDGIHLKPDGQKQYAKMIKNAIQDDLDIIRMEQEADNKASEQKESTSATSTQADTKSESTKEEKEDK